MKTKSLLKILFVFSIMLLILSSPDAIMVAEGAVNQETCSDSDGGLVPEISGYVEGIGRQGYLYTKYDVCEAGDYDGYLKEFFCNGTTPWAKRTHCPDGCADGACLSDPGTCTDQDGDNYAVEGGVCGLVDCDDSDPAINPGMSEDCANGIDDNCDGLIDSEDLACLVCTDQDGDGFAVEGAVCGLVDCDDGDPAVNPGISEDCANGIDDNCDGLIDSQDPACLVCTDQDSDGYAIDGGACGLVDCDDGDPAVNPGMSEDCANGIDDNCDGLIDSQAPACFVCTDQDGDGFAVEGGTCGLVDCDDGNQAVNPGMSEDCGNGIDDNCDGLVDAADPFCSVTSKNVIVVGWDGTQRDHLMECYNEELPECSGGLPNLESLSGRLIYNNTTTSGGTATKPGWAQIFTGYNADVLGIFDNGVYQPIPQGYTVFEKVENHFGVENIVTMFISGKGVHTGGACIGDPTTKDGYPVIEDKGQPWCITKNFLDYYENDLRQNINVGNRALELLENHQNDTFFALFLFRTPDVLGHLAGENSVDYSNSIIEDDMWLGTFVAKLQELNIYDNTLIYVTTDHGFDEGSNRHGNAPYGFLASNDPLIIRGGDRKDLAPTILERYGISLAADENSPAVDGFSLYSLPPFACVIEGAAFVDYDNAPFCCSGLDLIGLDRRSGPNCIIPTGGTGDNSGYCTNCGNGVCELNESRCNCPDDCP
ncbi:MopE-related protein [Chloroflexota bacterium]